MVFLSQTTLELDLTQIYLLGEQEVYLTKPVKGGVQQIVVKEGFESLGRSVQMYELTKALRLKLKLKK